MKKGARAFLNVAIRPEYLELRETVYDALERAGKRQLDPAPIRPSLRDVRTKLQEVARTEGGGK